MLPGKRTKYFGMKNALITSETTGDTSAFPLMKERISGHNLRPDDRPVRKEPVWLQWKIALCIN